MEADAEYCDLATLGYSRPLAYNMQPEDEGIAQSESEPPPSTKPEERPPAVEELPTGIEEEPPAVEEPPTGLEERLPGLEEEPTGLEEEPTAVEEQPTGLEEPPPEANAEV